MSESTPSPDPEKERNDEPALSDAEVQRMHAQILREKEEPQEGFPPVPIFLLFVFAIVVFTCGIYMGKNSAGFRWDVYDPNFDPAQLDEPPAEVVYDPIAAGERIFSQNCVACHQSNGQGLPGAFPPLVGTGWVQDTRVVPTAILLNGMNGPVEVAGTTYNGNMPAFGDLLSDRDIAAVLTYIRQAWGNTAGPITEAQVAEARDAHGGRAAPWTAEEVLTLSELSTPVE